MTRFTHFNALTLCGLAWLLLVLLLLLAGRCLARADRRVGGVGAQAEEVSFPRCCLVLAIVALSSVALVIVPCYCSNRFFLRPLRIVGVRWWPQVGAGQLQLYAEGRVG